MYVYNDKEGRVVQHRYSSRIHIYLFVIFILTQSTLVILLTLNGAPSYLNYRQAGAGELRNSRWQSLESVEAVSPTRSASINFMQSGPSIYLSIYYVSIYISTGWSPGWRTTTGTSSPG